MEDLFTFGLAASVIFLIMRILHFWISHDFGQWKEYRVCPKLHFGTEWHFDPIFCPRCDKKLPNEVVARARFKLFGYSWELRPPEPPTLEVGEAQYQQLRQKVEQDFQSLHKVRGNSVANKGLTQ